MKTVIYTSKHLRALFFGRQNCDFDWLNNGVSGPRISLTNSNGEPKVLSAEEIIIYDILLSYMTNNDSRDGNYTLMFRDINRIRGLKYFNASNSISSELAYVRALKSLTDTRIHYQENMFDLKQSFNLLYTGFIYTDTKIIGVIFKFEKRALDFINLKQKTTTKYNLFKFNFKEIISYQIIRYLILIIFLSSRDDSKIINVKTIMKQIVYFNRDGSSQKNNYYESITSNNKRTQLLTRFNKKLLAVLKVLKESNSIKDYKVNLGKKIDLLVDDDYSIKIEFIEKKLIHKEKKQKFIVKSSGRNIYK